MDTDATKLLQARLEELPEDVQRAIQSSDAENKIREIGTKHRLHIDQIEKLDDETRLVMLGFVSPDEFADQIGIEAKVSPREADAIAAEISTALFVPIRESMQKFMDERALLAQVLKEQKPASSASAPQTTPEKNISVVMPSSASAPQVPKPAPVSAPTKPSPTPIPSTKPQLDLPAPMRAADVMLSTPTISVPPKPAPPAPASAPQAPPAPKVEVPKPAPYKTDPYREPLE